MNDYRLVILLLIPLVGAVVASLLPDARTVRRWALAASLATAAYAAYLAVAYFADPGRGMKFVLGARGFSIADVGFTFGLGMDAIGLWLVLLTALLTPLAIAASFGSIRERQKEY